MLNEVRLRELARDAVERGGMALRPRRERGLWSFLTWSFFLSQLAAGNAFASGAAQAANAEDVSDPGDSSQATASAASFHGVPDFRMEAASELPPIAASSGATPAQTAAVHAAEKAGGIEQLDLTSDADLTQQSAMLPNSAAFVSTAPVAESDSSAIAVDMPYGSETATDLPQIAEVPPLLTEMLPPVLDTIDNLVEDLGSTLDDLFVPVVGTVEDLADVLSPTLDQALSPVGTLADNITSVLGETLDPVLTTVAGVAEGVGDILQPVGGIAGELIGLADPLIEAVAPVLEPVSTLVAAAEPLLDPVLEVATPVVALVEPVVEPLLQPLAPALAPVLEILPLGAATGGILNGFIGDGETDAIGSPGGIALAVETDTGGYDLMEAGVYTEFGITLQESPLDIAERTGDDLTGNVAVPIADLIDHADDANTLPSLLGSLQHEGALRGFGEGLI